MRNRIFSKLGFTHNILWPGWVVAKFNTERFVCCAQFPHAHTNALEEMLYEVQRPRDRRIRRSVGRR